MSKKKSPQTAAEWFEHGRRCFHAPDGVAAVKALERVIDLDPAYRHPNGDNPYFYLGKINEVEGRLEDAIVHYSRALAVDPGDEESLIGRGSCYTVVGKHEQAIADFTKLLQMPAHLRKVPPKHLLYVIAENYRRLEDWGQAVYYGQKALDADPGNQSHQELLKKIKAEMNR
jgi:tetratricopeptide (TPR) repeat protein